MDKAAITGIQAKIARAYIRELNLGCSVATLIDAWKRSPANRGLLSIARKLVTTDH